LPFLVTDGSQFDPSLTAGPPNFSANLKLSADAVPLMLPAIYFTSWVVRFFCFSIFGTLKFGNFYQKLNFHCNRLSSCKKSLSQDLLYSFDPTATAKLSLLCLLLCLDQPGAQGLQRIVYQEIPGERGGFVWCFPSDPWRREEFPVFRVLNLAHPPLHVAKLLQTNLFLILFASSFLQILGPPALQLPSSAQRGFP
jgi:hypothetical protein